MKNLLKLATILMLVLPAHSQDHLTNAQFRSTVQHLKTTTANVRKTLAGIDIGKLEVGYYHGSMFDQYRDTVRKSLDINDLIADRVLRDGNLSAAIDLQYATNELAHTVSDAATIIADATPPKQDEKNLQESWINDLQKESEQIGSDATSTLGYAMDRADTLEKSGR